MVGQLAGSKQKNLSMVGGLTKNESERNTVIDLKSMSI